MTTVISIYADMPARMKNLPIDRAGRPVPWFVAWPDGEPDFRIMDSRKLTLAVRERRCWVCGGKLTRHAAFVIGPMCTVNRISAEPPSHIECAEYSATHCPFLTHPEIVRRETRMPEGASDGAGIMLKRNPGVVCLWITKTWTVEPDRESGGILFAIGDPAETRWFREKRPATRLEAWEAISSGLPLLEATMGGDPRREDGLLELAAATAVATRYLPEA